VCGYVLTLRRYALSMPMCDACQALTAASKETAPHPALVGEERRAVGSIGGSADERYFRCRDCGHRWLYESGNLGYGWVA
jgi:hypothetical protein